MLYLIDTNILIYANKVTNPLDIHPTYWAKMKEILERDDVFSIDKVKDEIYYYEDDLFTWCKENIDQNFWLKTSHALPEYAELQNWVQTRNYNETALIEFADIKNADPFILAYSLNTIRKNQNITIVTLEVSSPDSKKKVKLPDVCIHFGVRFINNNEFFREISITF